MRLKLSWKQRIREYSVICRERKVFFFFFLLRRKQKLKLCRQTKKHAKKNIFFSSLICNVRHVHILSAHTSLIVSILHSKHHQNKYLMNSSLKRKYLFHITISQNDKCSTGSSPHLLHILMTEDQNRKLKPTILHHLHRRRRTWFFPKSQNRKILFWNFGSVCYPKLGFGQKLKHETEKCVWETWRRTTSIND